MDHLLEKFPIIIELPVAWGEMDVYGHVNNIIYFRYFESVRIAYLYRLEFLKIKENAGMGPILAQTSCRYTYPLSYPDTVSVGARVQTVNDDGFLMDYRVESQRHQRVAAKGDGLVVCFDYNKNKKVPLPDSIKKKIRVIEGQCG